jgi:hypothetical protein
VGHCGLAAAPTGAERLGPVDAARHAPERAEPVRQGADEATLRWAQAATAQPAVEAPERPRVAEPEVRAGHARPAVVLSALEQPE